MRFMEERRELRLPGLFYVDDLVFCDESKEELKVMVESFVEVFRRKDLKVYADKSRVMELGGKQGLECEIYVDRTRLEQV